MNINFFNRNKSNKNKTEQASNDIEKIVVPSVSNENTLGVKEPPRGENFNENLKNLQKLIEIKRGMDGKISSDEVLRVSGMTLDQLLNYLNGKKVSIEASGEEIMKTLEFALSATEGDAKEGLMQKFANDKVKRGIIMLLILMGKFAPQAHGAEEALLSVKDKTMNKTETTFEKKTEPDTNTYYAFDKGVDKDKGSDAKTPDSKLEGNHTLFTLKLTDHFSTDSEKIIEGDKKVIEKDFKNFLNRLTPESAKKIIASNLKVMAFCDKRPTTKWGTNLKLATARGISAVDFLGSILKDPNSTKQLPKEIREQLQSVKIVHEVYESKTGPEKGVKYITDLLNPDTGKNFTQDEVNKLEQDAKTSSEANAKLLELHSECRGVVFDITAENDNISPLDMHMKTIDLKIPEPAVKHWLGGYNNILIIADKTPSIKEGGSGRLPSNLYIAKIISGVKDLDGVKKYVFGAFDSNGLYSDLYKEVKNLQDVSKEIENLDGRGDGSREASLTAAIQALENFHPEPGDKSVVKILTDEPLQDVSYSNYSMLKMLSEKEHFDVAFAYGDDKKESLNEISLNEVGKILNDHILKLNGHPSVDKILEAKDGKTVEDHIGEIFGPLVSNRANEIIKWYTDVNNSQAQYFEKMLKSSQEKVDKYMKVGNGISDKNSKKYKEASNQLSDAERVKNFNEYKISSNKTNADICNEYGKELKKLADSYVKTGDKSILSHPYFTLFAGLINEKDYFSNQKNVDIGVDKFVDKIDLHSSN